MAYTREITRKAPGCMVFLIDQSGSMSEPLVNGGGKTKAEAVADAINELLYVTVTKCDRHNTIRDYFQVGVIGYHTDDTGNIPAVGPAFVGQFQSQDLVPISQIANFPAGIKKTKTMKKDLDTNKQIEFEIETPYWFEPRYQGKTPMCTAYAEAYRIVAKWAADHQDSFPPMIMNITDGLQTDGTSADVITAASKLMNISTADGNALVYACHLGVLATDVLSFPVNLDGMAGKMGEEYEFASALFSASSIIPDALLNQINTSMSSTDLKIEPGARGFVFNANLKSLINFLNVGTPTPAQADK